MVMMPLLFDEMKATMTSIMMIIMAVSGKSAVFFMTCLTENHRDRA
jgi:hypothetical protein